MYIDYRNCKLMKDSGNNNFKQNDDYKEKLFESFKDKSNNFIKSFGLLIGFTLIFLFAIILPLYSLQLQKSFIND